MITGLGLARKWIDIVGIPPHAGVIVDPPPQDITGDFCFIEGSPMCRSGQVVSPHGLPPHDLAVIITSSLVTYCNKVGIVRLGDMASCLDVVTTSSLIVYSI